MIFYNIENLYQKCKKCRIENDKKDFSESNDMYFYTRNLSHDFVGEFFSNISECFDLKCLDNNLFENNIEIDEKILLYKIISNKNETKTVRNDN